VASQRNTGPVRRKAAELSAFVARLRQCLDEQGMSQADLARELGVGVATVSEWFTRGRVPGGEVMLRLPHVLRVNGHWMLTGEGPRHLERGGASDPYLQGVDDALAHVARQLDEAAKHFGVGRSVRSASGASAARRDPASG
jgi:transcriptional regulator with XRE-family HTH domain